MGRLVNMQAVIADTQRGIAEVQAEIDKLLRRDIDGRALVSNASLPPLTNSEDLSMSVKRA